MAGSLKSPYVIHRWIGGTFTNFSQVRNWIIKLLHLEDVLAKSASSHYTKKEIVTLSKVVERLGKNVSSIRGMTWPVGALVVVDVKKEQTAIKEARVMGIPIVGIVDTNSDPSLVDYVIPANDDAPKAIACIMDYLAQAVERGKAVAAERPTHEQAQSEEIAAVELAGVSALNSEETDDKRGAKKGKIKEPIATKPRRSPAGAGPKRRN